MYEFVFGRPIPVRIKPQKRNVLRREIRQGIFYFSFNKMHCIVRVSCTQ